MTMRTLLTLAAAFAVPALAMAGTSSKRPSKPAAGEVKTMKRIPLPDSAAIVALLTGVHNAACPLAGVATGGQPDSAHLGALAKAGFTTVLDLRAADEPRGFDEASAMRAAGLHYVELPITPATLVDSTFDAFRTAMAKGGADGVFVHCASGNRVGAAMIPWLVLDRGWGVERAVSTARLGGLKSAALEAKALDYVARKRAAR